MFGMSSDALAMYAQAANPFGAPSIYSYNTPGHAGFSGVSSMPLPPVPQPQQAAAPPPSAPSAAPAPPIPPPTISMPAPTPIQVQNPGAFPLGTYQYAPVQKMDWRNLMI